MRKPIICAKDTEESGLYSYRNCFIGWVLNVKIEFLTDLNKKQFNDFLDGKYNWKQIEKFELTGRKEVKYESKQS